VQDFWGRGWSFPPRLTGGATALSEGEDKIRQSIGIILETAKGERAMRPDFGCGIHEFVFQSLNASTINGMRQSVREALILWEPRIDVLNVSVSTDSVSHDPKLGAVAITIEYRVRATNAVFNYVYPFYLQSGG
jgi:phage baseplate assembly protein W